MTPLVSVIIPVYNVEKYLEQCVESVLSQTYDSLEIILVDDGSTDNSGVICDEYAEKDCRVKIIHKENGGASSARNLGLTEAQGEYVYFVDSDDYIEQKTVSSLVENAISNNSDLVFFDAIAFDEETGKQSKDNYSHKGSFKTDSGFNMMVKLMRFNEFHVSTPLFFIKASLLLENGIRFIEGIMFEDCVFSYKLFSSARSVSYLPEYLYHRRYRANSVMTSNLTNHKVYSAIRAFLELLKVYDSLEQKEKTNAFLVRIAFNAVNCFSEASSEIKNNNKENYKYLLSELEKHRFFGDSALKARTHGKAAWAAVKLLQKVRGY